MSDRTALIYGRISLDMKKDGANVDRLLADARDTCADLGAEIIGEYRDDDTGASKLSKSRKRKGRPGFDALSQAIEQLRPTYVVITDFDRLTRDPDEVTPLIELASRAKGRYEIHCGGSLIDLTTPDGIKRARDLATAAEHEINKMSRRMKNANRTRRKNGVMTFRRRCFGYAGKMNGKVYPEGATVGDVIPAEAKLIREMAKRAIDGDSQMSIAMWLNGEGVKTAGGGRWQSAGVKSLLESARIVGWVEHDGEFIREGNWEPIITREMQDAVRVAFRMRTRGKPGPKAMLTGLLRCSVCGKPMYRGISGNGKATYRCAPRPDRQTGCGNVMVAHAVEGFVTDYVLKWAPKLHAASRKRFKLDKLSENVATIVAQLEDLDRKLDAEIIEYDRWSKTHDLLSVRLKAAREAERSVRTDETVRQLAGNLGTLSERWDDLTDDGKRLEISVFVKSVTISPAKRRGGPVDWDRIDIEPTETLATILTAA